MPSAVHIHHGGGRHTHIEWHEEDHPRNKSGEFARTASSGGPKDPSKLPDAKLSLKDIKQMKEKGISLKNQAANPLPVSRNRPDFEEIEPERIVKDTVSLDDVVTFQTSVSRDVVARYMKELKDGDADFSSLSPEDFELWYNADTGEYQLENGNHRLAALKLLGKKEFEAKVIVYHGGEEEESLETPFMTRTSQTASLTRIRREMKEKWGFEAESFIMGEMNIEDLSDKGLQDVENILSEAEDIYLDRIKLSEGDREKQVAEENHLGQLQKLEDQVWDEIKARTEKKRTQPWGNDLLGKNMSREQYKTHKEHIQKTSDALCKELNFPSANVHIEDESYEFTVDGKKMTSAGTAYLSGDRAGQIVIRAKEIRGNERDVEYVLSHEIGHQVFERVNKMYQKERDELDEFSNELKAQIDQLQDEGKDVPESLWKEYDSLRVRPDGTLPPEGAQRFPLYQIYQERIGSKWNKLVKDDGCSWYSEAYWNDWKKGKVNTDLAFHETFAEMARLHIQSKRTKVPFGNLVKSREWQRVFQAYQRFTQGKTSVPGVKRGFRYQRDPQPQKIDWNEKISGEERTTNAGEPKKLDWGTLREGVAHGKKFKYNGMVIERQASEHVGASHVAMRETWKINGETVTKSELKNRLELS